MVFKKKRILLVDNIRCLQTKDEEKTPLGGSIKENDLHDYGR